MHVDISYKDITEFLHQTYNLDLPLQSFCLGSHDPKKIGLETNWKISWFSALTFQIKKLNNKPPWTWWLGDLVTYNKHHFPCICGLAAFVLWLLSSAGFTHGSMVSCQGGWERANLRSFTWRLISDPHGLPSRSGWVCGWAPREQEEVWMASWSPHLKPVQLGFPHSVGPDKWQNQLRFQEWRIRLHLILAGRRCKELWLLSLFLIYLPNSFMTRSAIFTPKKFWHQSSH